MMHLSQHCKFLVKGIQAVLRDKKKLDALLQNEQGEKQGRQNQGYHMRSNQYDKFLPLADSLGTEGPSVSFAFRRG